ncbi:hypothetical protein BN1723_018527, partial [Verticillium longisporum]
TQTSSFVEQAREAAMNLTNDDGGKAQFGDQAKSGMRWDKKQNKYVARANDEDGSKGKKYIRGESGTKIAASFQSGRYDKWRKANRMGKPRPLLGRISDSVGRKPPYLITMFIFAMANVWCATATSMTSFIFARAACGLGAGGMMTLGSIIISDMVTI